MCKIPHAFFPAALRTGHGVQAFAHQITITTTIKG